MTSTGGGGSKYQYFRRLEVEVWRLKELMSIDDREGVWEYSKHHKS